LRQGCLPLEIVRKNLLFTLLWRTEELDIKKGIICSYFHG
jgi:hypothetical protein